MISEPSAGGVVINSNGQVLVVNQDGSVWSLPKGHVEPGEELRVAAEREIYEESGISEVHYVRDLGTYERYKARKAGIGEYKDQLKSITIFLYTTEQMKLAPKDPQNPYAKWVDPQEVADILTIEKDKEFYSSVLPEVLKFLATNN